MSLYSGIVMIVIGVILWAIGTSSWIKEATISKVLYYIGIILIIVGIIVFVLALIGVIVF